MADLVLNVSGEQINSAVKTINDGIYTLFENKYSTVPLVNGFKKSDGSKLSGNTYKKAYDELLAIFNGTKQIEGVSVKQESDSTKTEFDFKINTTDKTFILPTLNGDENLPSSRTIALTISKTGDSYIAPANGFLYTYRTGVQSGHSSQIYTTDINGSSIYGTESVSNYNNSTLAINIQIARGQKGVFYWSGSDTSIYHAFKYAKGNGSLYFYLGN